MHDKPYQTYSASQLKLKNTIVNEFVIIEDKLVNFIRHQEKVYNYLYNLLCRFTTSNDAINDRDVLKLLFNTDADLLNKDIPLKDKICSALQLMPP